MINMIIAESRERMAMKEEATKYQEVLQEMRSELDKQFSINANLTNIITDLEREISFLQDKKVTELSSVKALEDGIKKIAEKWIKHESKEKLQDDGLIGYSMNEIDVVLIAEGIAHEVVKLLED